MRSTTKCHFHIWHYCVCFGDFFYKWEHFVMLIIKSIQLISVHSWTYLNFIIMPGFERNLNSSLPLGQVALKFCCPGQVLVCSFNDLVCRWLADPLNIGQVRMKSYLPRRRIYLSQTTGQQFFGALHTCQWQIHLTLYIRHPPFFPSPSGKVGT